MIVREFLARSGSRFLHGGSAQPIRSDDEERRTLHAVVDTLIPPEDGWPPAAQLDIGSLIAAYVIPDDWELSLFPHVREAELRERLTSLGGAFAGADLDARVEILRRLERDEPDEFARLHDLVYYVFYGHPKVAALIGDRSRWGRDFHGAPQPIGYREVLEAWDAVVPPDAGGHIATDGAHRVQRLAGQGGRRP
jgi:hypothetical protein